MRTFAIILLCLGAAVFLPAAKAMGGMHIIPLPELTGSYSCVSLTSFPGPERKQVYVQTTLPWNDVTKVTLVFTGTADYGLVRGDGKMVVADEAVLFDGYSVSLAIGNCHFNPEHGALVGTEPAELAVYAPFDGSTGGWLLYPPLADPVYFFADVELVLDPANSLEYGLPGHPLAFIPPHPVEPLLWGDGLVLVEPVSVNISDAYLIVEGPTLPEPATLSLLALGGLLALRRRARR